MERRVPSTGIWTGTWTIVSSPDFDYDYLSMEVAPYVRLSQEGIEVAGEYRVGLQTGDLDVRLQTSDRAVSASRGRTRWTR